MLSPWFEIFAEYASTWVDVGRDGQWFHAFELPRAHLGVGATWHGLRARALVESVRTAGRGDADDTLVVRFREAWIGYLLFGLLDLGAGLVPTLTIPALEGGWIHRVVSPVAFESWGLASPVDLGGRVTLRLPRSFGSIGVASYAGSGYESGERDRGPGTELFAAIRPLGLVPALRPLGVVVSYVIGSTDGGARANRFTGALAWDTERFAAGLVFHYAWGVAGDGARRGWLLEGFARAEPVRRLMVALRVSRLVHDVDLAADRSDQLRGAIGVRIAAPFELWLALDRNVPSDRAASAERRADSWTVRLAARAALGL